MAAAVTAKFATTAKAAAKDAGKAADKKAPGKKSEIKEARLIVVADSNVIADKLFPNAGNAYFFVDGLKWIVGDEDIIGELTSEEDVKIRHTRDEDHTLFYGTIFLVPIAILGGGIGYTRLRRRRRRSA